METNDTNVNVTDTEVTETDESKGKFYTEEDIALIEQKAGDKRISQYQKTMEKKQREAEKLRNMSAEDKREYDMQQKELELASREEALLIAENKAECLSILADKGLDTKLVGFVLDSDADVMYENIKLLEKCFKNSVRAEVEKRLASKTPSKAFDQITITKDQFKKMDMSEMLRLKEEQPEMFDALKSKMYT